MIDPLLLLILIILFCLAISFIPYWPGQGSFSTTFLLTVYGLIDNIAERMKFEPIAVIQSIFIIGLVFSFAFDQYSLALAFGGLILFLGGLYARSNNEPIKYKRVTLEHIGFLCFQIGILMFIIPIILSQF